MNAKSSFSDVEKFKFLRTSLVNSKLFHMFDGFRSGRCVKVPIPCLIMGLFENIGF